MKPQVWNRRDPKCPKEAVYVGRPSIWGNPFKIGFLTREETVALYRTAIVSGWDRSLIQRLSDDQLNVVYGQHCAWLIKWWKRRKQIPVDALGELRGKDLVCWCAPLPCHADVLLELAEVADA